LPKIESSTKGLAEHHLARLKASGLSDAVIARRGYYTEYDAEGLTELGFDRKQRVLVPALVIPVRDTSGEVVLHRIRPDEPRVNGHKPDKLNKYESPKGSSIVLDIPPFSLEHLHDRSYPLWVTEGEIKADALASQGEVAVAILGVWAWKRYGFPLEAFDDIPMIRREIRVVFDSDCLTNVNVRHALMCLSRYLKGRIGDA
jgi:hypothetical protein